MQTLNTKKILPKIENAYQAIDVSIANGQNLISAIFIMQSILDNPNDMEYHREQIGKFLNQFFNKK